MHEDVVDNVVTMVNCRRTREAIGYDVERCVRRKVSPCRLHCDPAFLQYLELLVELRLAGHPVFVYDADAKVEVSIDVYKSVCRLMIETNIETEVRNGEPYKVIREDSMRKALNAEMFHHGGFLHEEARPNNRTFPDYPLLGTLHPTLTTTTTEGGEPKYLCLLEYYPFRARNGGA